MKTPYNWDYNIRIKTKTGTFEYEKETLDNLDLLLEQHPDYEELRASRIKLRCDKCNIEVTKPFIQQGENRTYRLCPKCNELYMKYNRNVQLLKKLGGKK